MVALAGLHEFAESPLPGDRQTAQKHGEKENPTVRSLSFWHRNSAADTRDVTALARFPGTGRLGADALLGELAAIGADVKVRIAITTRVCRALGVTGARAAAGPHRSRRRKKEQN